MDADSLKHWIKKYPVRELQNNSGEYTGTIMLGPVRLAFANLAKPKKDDSGKENYQAALIVPAAVDLSVAKTVVGRVAAEKFGPDWQKKMQSGALKSPFKSQAPMAEKYDGFEEAGFFINVKRSATIEPIPFFGRDMQPLPLDKIYSGMWAIAKVRPYSYKGTGNAGVSFGIEGLQFLADDEEFKGVAVTDGFGEIEEHGGASGPAKANGAAEPAGASADMW
jgi:hypothetical protein